MVSPKHKPLPTKLLNIYLSKIHFRPKLLDENYFIRSIRFPKPKEMKNIAKRNISKRAQKETCGAGRETEENDEHHKNSHDSNRDQNHYESEN